MEHVRRRHAVLRAGLGLLVLALVVSAVVAYGLIRAVFNPHVDEPIPQADALVVLGPVDSKLQTAVDLMGRGAARTLVISDQDQRDGAPGACRPEVVADVAQRGWSPTEPNSLLCFRPIPVTTQGEAMAIRDFGQTFGWSSVNVLAYPEHITRARILVDRCWTQDAAFVSAPGGPASQGTEAARDAFWYQSGALGKAAITSDCDTLLPRWLEQLSWRL